MGYICTRCGGTNVACEAIVNPNTGKIIDYFDGSFMHAICSNCENEVIISNIEEVKHEIDLRFHEFVERTGKEPEYVECQIVRKETGDEQRKTMKLSLSINDDDNDMSIKVIRYRLPSYWACPLINDDYTGLTDEECEEIQRFLEAAEGYPVDVDLETQGFYRCNDAGTLPGECADFIFHKCND